jgi:hypothetical protein
MYNTRLGQPLQKFVKFCVNVTICQRIKVRKNKRRKGEKSEGLFLEDEVFSVKATDLRAGTLFWKG